MAFRKTRGGVPFCVPAAARPKDPGGAKEARGSKAELLQPGRRTPGEQEKGRGSAAKKKESSRGTAGMASEVTIESARPFYPADRKGIRLRGGVTVPPPQTHRSGALHLHPSLRHEEPPP